MGVRHLMRDAPPDLILSGINQGANLGRETVFSGTVGAAMADILLGIPSVALGAAVVRGDPVHWETALTHGPAVLRRLSGMPWSPRACLNVNFPNVPPDQAGPLPAFARTSFAGMTRERGLSQRDPNASIHGFAGTRTGGEDQGRSIAHGQGYDLVVIGSGVAAQAASARVRKAGWSVAVIDHRPFGGTCVLRGCGPKKVLVGGEEAVDFAHRMGDMAFPRI